MGFLSRMEGKMEDTVEGAADRVSGTPLSPVQIAKKAEKQMRREKMVGAGKQYAPTLYTVLVNPNDDHRLFGYYPTLAGETETYLSAKANEQGLIMDGQPLVRFIVDEDLKQGKFEVIAEMVAAPLVAQLRHEEMERYGLVRPQNARGVSYRSSSSERASQPSPQPQVQSQAEPRVSNEAYDIPPQQEIRQREAAPEIPAQPAEEEQAVPQRGRHSRMAAQPYAEDSYREEAPRASQRGRQASDPYGNAEAYGQAPASPQPSYDQPDYPVDYAAGPKDRASYEPVETPVTATPQTMVFGQAPAAGAAANQPHAALTAYLYDMSNDRAFTLTGGKMRIGRESRNDIVIPDINVSRLHAEIRQDPSGAWLLTDLGSTNGTYVNGQQIKSMPLHDADRIVIGTTKLEFQLI